MDLDFGTVALEQRGFSFLPGKIISRLGPVNETGVLTQKWAVKTGAPFQNVHGTWEK